LNSLGAQQPERPRAASSLIDCLGPSGQRDREPRDQCEQLAAGELLVVGQDGGAAGPDELAAAAG